MSNQIGANQILAMLSQKQKKWTEMIEEYVSQIKSLKPTDRMSYAQAITKIINALAFSLKGWSQWFSSIDMLNNISEEEYKKIFTIMRKHALGLLQLDFQITLKKEKEQEEKKKKQKKKGKKTTSQKGYIA